MSPRYHGPVNEASFGVDWSAGLRRAEGEEVAAWLAFAIDCADLADEISLATFQTELAVDSKTDGSFVTEADRRIESLIRSRIADRYPDHGVVGEEYGIDSGTGRIRWFLDPIDSTHNFMRGVPVFATLLAVESDGEIQAGVVSAPAIARRWYGSRGGGAWVVAGPKTRPRRLQVSGERSISRSQLLFRSVTDMRASRVASGFDALLPMVWRERGYGDFWGYMLVADGAAEAMIEQDLGPWDLAAPSIVIEEAGGRITDFDGQRSFARGESLATNGWLHEAFLERLWERAADPAQPAAR